MVEFNKALREELASVNLQINEILKGDVKEDDAWALLEYLKRKRLRLNFQVSCPHRLREVGVDGRTITVCSVCNAVKE